MENLESKVDLESIGISLSDVKNILPNWKTKIVEVHQYKNSIGYELMFLLAARTVSDTKQWLNDYEELTKSAYSIRSTSNCTGTRVAFKQRLNCKQNTRNTPYKNAESKTKRRNTNCPSSITITLRAINKRYRGKDKNKAPDRNFPCEVRLNPVHNHPVGNLDILKLRPVKDEIRKQLLYLFQVGHSASTALKTLKIDIQLKEANFQEVLADRSVCPDYMFCYYLYKNHFKSKFVQLKSTKEYLERRIEQYNESNEDCARIEFVEDDYVISLCPTLMKRVHMYIENAADVVFIGSAGTLDQTGNRIYILSTISECGGLPLGIIITSSDSPVLLINGFQLLQDIVGTTIFGGNLEGPSVFMTEDSISEQIAVQTVWPNSRCLLSIFYVLRSVWKWITNPKNSIQLEHQHLLYEEFRAVVYASDLLDCKEAYEIALKTAARYTQYCTFLQTYWEHKDMWTISCRNNLRMGHDTNNNSEAAMHLLEENIFERIRSFNLVQTTDFILTRFEQLYKRRIYDAAHNRTTESLLYQTIKMPPSDSILQIQTVTDYLHLVPSDTSSPQILYIVNTEVLVCTCVYARNGYICKHINWICMLVRCNDFIKSIDYEAIRRKLYFIATGKHPPLDWLTPKIEHNAILVYSSETEIDYEQLIEDGTKLVNDINDGFMEYLRESPSTIIKALDLIKGGLRDIETKVGFSIACHTLSESLSRSKECDVPPENNDIEIVKTEPL